MLVADSKLHGLANLTMSVTIYKNQHPSCLQILEYHVYAAAAYKASDLEKHDTLVTKEGEAFKVNHLRLS